MSYQRRGDWILTFSGIAYWPLDPRVEDVRLEDIAHALSLENRYGGHTYEAYSVAQHSCLVHDHLPLELQAQGLMHDAPEAYVKDIPRPIKKYLDGYKHIERMNAAVIGRAFGLELVELPPAVHVADNEALFTEKRDLRPSEPRLDHAAPAWIAPWPERIHPWPAKRAEAEFLQRAHTMRLYAHCR